MADLYCCMAETSTISKAIILQIKFLKISKLLGKNLNNNIYETRILIFLDFYLMPTYHRKIVSPFLEINDFTVYFCIIVRLYQISHVISIFSKYSV